MKQKIIRVLIYTFLIGAALFCLIPFYSMIMASTHSNSEIVSEFIIAPGGEFRENYQRLVESVDIWRGLVNTLFVALTATALKVYCAALVGYGFSKYDFKFKKILFSLVLGTMMIPGALSIIGFYSLMEAMGLLNTYWPLILPAMAYAFGVFLMKQFADDSIPKEMIEAARIDGCGEIAIFHKIALPMLKPAVATLAILGFISKWNDYLTPVTVITDMEKQTLPVMIAGLSSQFVSDYGAQYVGMVISVVPILIMFSIMSRRIIDGVAAGSVKG